MGIHVKTIGIGYDVDPSDIEASVKISLNNTTLRAKIQDVHDFSFSITPHGGDIGGDILSGVAWPVARIVAEGLKGKIRNAIEGVSFDVMDIPNITINVQGHGITLKPSNMNVSNYEGMLLIGSDINIT